MNIIIIMAAGKSTRFGHNKLLMPLASKPIIEYSIDQAIQAKPDHIILITNNNFTLHNKYLKHNITNIIQAIPNGTGGALEYTLPFLRSLNCKTFNLTILFADTPFITQNTIQKLFNNDINTACTTAIQIDNNSQDYGHINLDKNNTIINIKEYKENTQAAKHDNQIFTCSGAMNFHISFELLQQAIKTLPFYNHGEKYLTDMFAILRTFNCFTTLLHINNDQGLGINTAQHFQAAQQIINKQLIQQALEKGAIIHDPTNTYLAYNTKIESGAIIHPFVILGEDTILKSTAVIHPFSVVNHSTIAGSIGPFAYIRNNTYIENNAIIGSFVEIKQSTFAEFTKAKHLSYIGDTTVGAHTNIGAGSITCNYSKQTGEKAQTIIGEHCDIGADTKLIAPVTIGNNGQTGAGSIITIDIMENTLSVTRSPQKHYPKRTFSNLKKK